MRSNGIPRRPRAGYRNGWPILLVIGGLCEPAWSAPSARELLAGHPSTVKITASVRERTAPSSIDVEDRVEKLRRQMLRDKMAPLLVEQRVEPMRKTWESMRRGTDQSFQRTYYAKRGGKVRLSESGKYLADGQAYRSPG